VVVAGVRVRRVRHGRKLLHEKEKLREWMDTVPGAPRSRRARSHPPRSTDAIAKKEKELEAEAAQQRRGQRRPPKQVRRAEAAAQPAAAPKKAEVEVKGPARSIRRRSTR
jgi:hypothetical protein